MKKSLIVGLIAGISAVAGTVAVATHLKNKKKDSKNPSVSLEDAIANTLHKYDYTDFEDNLEDCLKDNRLFVNRVISLLNGDYSERNLIKTIAKELLRMDRDTDINVNVMDDEEIIDYVIVPLANEYLDLSSLNLDENDDYDDYEDDYDDDDCDCDACEDRSCCPFI